MQRRSFLKLFLEFLALVFMPMAKANRKKDKYASDIYASNNPNSKVKWSRYKVLEPSTKPLFDDLDSYGRFEKIKSLGDL